MSEVYSSNDGKSAAALTQAWADRVIGNRDQAERLREEQGDGDHYRPLASMFRADPHRTDDEVLDALLAFADSTDTWIDVGAGAGRFSLPLALHVKSVVAVEPSGAMRAEFANLQLEHDITNVELRDDRWPSDDPAVTDIGDVALISHVAYDIEPIDRFLDTLERSARRECVAVLFDESPSALFWQVWPAIHGEDQVRLPGGNEFTALLEARGADLDVSEIGRGIDRRRFRFDSLEHAMEWARRRLWLAEDSIKLPALSNAVAALLIEQDGAWSLPDQPTQMLIRWRTR
ncbi:MAG: hypothetical protein OXH38_09675 [Chloroflexi bacterium]|nr:hypothetical protein [Chloroflexota bacterium]